ncbi:nuclear protein UL55 [Equid alphaherpesvirus 4]|uniref:4 n=2 Tax=Equid alphaherpesvirus 4 TaxID=10331 RepID=A0A288CFX1_EHV4|nr:nuclear protein UL55 [Equid alphaherpesvirus 4]AAC59557.1 4 [Equid alphaherpesvirus 4] [Equid alphaherpesvirus 4]AMB15886.1 nuclear protein UL55 [Equid alphaherpesvirus 4]AMB15965.1 nuclear protein UL55 [Equid alphaherpesvirus 4]AMB16044.1 nuclear protein UL55 [Equid alphaherpesvirus 4]AMB16123.1 nuclear protein UL55 [Equid alphaherpesvirus 4]
MLPVARAEHASGSKQRDNGTHCRDHGGCYSSDCKLGLLVDISNVVSPLPLDLTWSSWETTSQPAKSRSYLNTRTYTIRACCDIQARLHAFFIGVFEKRDPEKQISLPDLINFRSILNNTRIMQELAMEHSVCGAPFSAATQYDCDQDGEETTINGLCFHCHCKTPFSLECWQAANAAQAKILSVARGITSAKERQRCNKQ